MGYRPEAMLQAIDQRPRYRPEARGMNVVVIVFCYCLLEFARQHMPVELVAEHAEAVLGEEVEDGIQ